MAPVHLAASVAVVGLMLSGCSGPPNVYALTPNGPVSLYTPSPTMPGGQVGPPPGLGSPPVPTPQPGDINGTYTGAATLFATAGNLCRETLKIVGFRVYNGRVRFGRYRGRIDSDGGLQMVSDNQWIIGQFEGATFHGQVTFQNNFTYGCTYLINLQRTSA